MSTSASFPAANVVEDWDTEKLIEFLREQNLGLTEDHFKILRREEIRGRSFLRMDEKIFKDSGFKIGPTLNLLDIINKIKGEGQRKNHDCIRIFQTYDIFCNEDILYFTTIFESITNTLY